MGLGVQSRREVGWIVSESVWLVCRCFADGFVGGEASKGLQPLGEVVSAQEGGEMLPQLVVVVVVVAFDGGLLEGPVHAFNLAVGPRVVGLGQPVLDAVLPADAIEQVHAVATVGPSRREGWSQNCTPLSVRTVWIA